jgi:hypothetical protein
VFLYASLIRSIPDNESESVAVVAVVRAIQMVFVPILLPTLIGYQFFGVTPVDFIRGLFHLTPANH